MASKFNNNPLIQPSTVQATVSHVQVNPIAIRRTVSSQAPVPQQAAYLQQVYQAQEAPQPEVIPAPAPTRLLVTGAQQPAYYAPQQMAQQPQVEAIPAPAPTRLLVPGAQQPAYYAPQQMAQQPQASYPPEAIPAPAPTRLLVPGAQQPAYYAPQQMAQQPQVEAIPAPAPTRLLVPGAQQPAYYAPQQMAQQPQAPSHPEAIPAPAPTRMLLTGAPQQPQIPIQVPQQAHYFAGQVSEQYAPYQEAAPPAQTPATAQVPFDPYDQPQTPQTHEMALQKASQDPETAAFDARLTSLAQIPYYSLTQLIANHRAFSPDSGYDYPVIEAEDHEMAEDRDTRYADEEKVGEGGTSVVYLANDTRLRRKVAIKRFRQISRSNDESEYLNELERTSSISHPYVVSAYDADIDRKGRFIVMEYIHGLDMETVVGKKTLNFSLNRFMNFAHKALEGLEAIHEAGLLHLDLKPSNIMLDVRESGRDLVKIIDFGRAEKIVQEDGSAPCGRGLNGSILYSAPEQLLSESLDQRTDLYSLGCIFYWVLTGTRSFDGPNPVSIMSAHLRHIVTDISEIIPTLPEWLGKLIMSMMSLEQEDRPKTAREVIEILDTDGQTGKVAQFQA